MHPKVEQAIQEIDAAFFSGDAFVDHDARREIRNYIEAWERKLSELDADDVEAASADDEEDPRSNYCDHGAAQAAEEVAQLDEEFDLLDEADMEPPRDTDDADAPTEAIDGFTAEGGGSFLDECNYGERK